MNASWLDLLGAAAGGGILTKVLDYFVEEYRRLRDHAKDAQEILDKHLDPVLKAADELVAKLGSLAQNDFVELTRQRETDRESLDEAMDLGATCYLFAQFWARIQLLRIESLYVNLAATARGNQLQDFVHSLESTGIRLLKRARQRGIGEALIDTESSRVLLFHEFMGVFQRDDGLNEWIAPLIEQLTKAHHKSNRQRILVYGVIVHAMMDTLDPEHRIVRDRRTWFNKLTVRSQRELKERVFKIYLPFVEEPEKYYGSWGS